ncbi:unnamed protein product [Coccothraustes coccothraustes]
MGTSEGEEVASESTNTPGVLVIGGPGSCRRFPGSRVTRQPRSCLLPRSQLRLPRLGPKPWQDQRPTPPFWGLQPAPKLRNPQLVPRFRSLRPTHHPLLPAHCPPHPRMGTATAMNANSLPPSGGVPWRRNASTDKQRHHP